jgi:hypothetical protein
MIRTGKSGPPPNPAGRRSRTRTKKTVPLRQGLLVIPDPPTTLTDQYKELWVAMWGSPLARAWNTDIDTIALARLFSLYQERDKLQLDIRYAQCTDLPILNKLRIKIDFAILALEDRFGLSPSSRLPLGLKHREIEYRSGELFYEYQ